MLTQLVPAGSYLTWPKPFAALAVMDPVRPVDWSRMSACTPCGVSRRDTASRSPEFMNRSFAGTGVNVAVLDCTGLAGAPVRPSLVTNAKLRYSRPVLAAQVAFWVVPATGSSDRLSMVIAAHHRAGSHPLAP